MTQTQYPILVYGTLRTGQGNWKGLLRGETVQVETVTIPGFVMRDNRGGFPFVEHSTPTDSIVAELMYIAPNSYDRVLKMLDQLEGYVAPNHPYNLYERELIQVDVNGVTRVAYIYTVAVETRSMISDLKIITHGDWVAHKAQLAGY